MVLLNVKSCVASQEAFATLTIVVKKKKSVSSCLDKASWFFSLSEIYAYE